MFATLLLLTAAIYAQTYRFGFVDFDDAEYVTDNPYVHHGLSAGDIKNAFTTYHVGNYAPLVSLSYCVDDILFRLRPGPMHLENVLLHLLSGLLLWRLIFLATGKLARGFAVAALFLVHPMHVESVAWIAERKDVLSTPLLLAAMLAYARYCGGANRKRWFAYAAMLVFFALSLMAKSMGVTLPAVLLLMDAWPLRRWPATGWLRLMIEKLPLMVLSIAASVMAAIAQRFFGATSSLADLSIADRINNALVCYVIYIVKLAVPTNLAVFYQHPGKRPIAVAIAAAGLLLLISFLAFRLRKTRPYLLIGWLWFLGTLVPVIGLVQVGSQAMADRYSYFPSIGLLIASVWFFSDELKSAAVRNLMLGIILIALSITAWRQTSYWKNSQTLFKHAVAVTDVNPVAHLVLGKIAYQRGDLNAARDEYNLARKPFENPRALDGIANCLMASNRSQAIALYRAAVDLNPRMGAFHADLANALWLNGQRDEARSEAAKAVSLNPGTRPAVEAILNAR
jgi:tetratricopeptide (TPR) repeat protein